MEVAQFGKQRDKKWERNLEDPDLLHLFFLCGWQGYKQLSGMELLLVGSMGLALPNQANSR